jgi:glycine/D-amino acid oxidase-like deaminating enzyme
VPRLRHGHSLWLDQTQQATRTYPKYRGVLRADVVIIGGGITGAICADLFSDAGIGVALLESKVVARGSTAASTALLMQEPDRDFSELTRRLGRSAARDIWIALQRATRDLARRIRRLRIDCELRPRDSVYYTLDPKKVRALRKEFEARKRAGLPGRWLSAADLHKETGIIGQAAIATAGNAEVNPIRACHGFVAAAVARGARVFERSPVLRIKASRASVTVRTAGGTIEANSVVVATGYSTPGFEPYVGRFTMTDTYVIATRRLPRRIRRGIPGSRAMGWDTDRPYHYVRWTSDGRLLVGGGDTAHRGAKGARGRISRARDRLTSYVTAIYPALAREQPAYAWEGLFAETPDGLPYIGTHSHYPNHLFALGYGGNGMTASFLAATLLLRLYRARDTRSQGDRTLDLFAFRRRRK